jgi:hypothetical protein
MGRFIYANRDREHNIKDQLVNKFSFPEMVSVLQLTQLKAKKYKNDKLLDTDFWYIVDHLENEKLYTWGMRMLKKKWIVQGTNFIKVCGILTEYEESKSWTIKQKRYLAMMIISNWDDVSLDYIY